jgi:hypothetical protein
MTTPNPHRIEAARLQGEVNRLRLEAVALMDKADSLREQARRIDVEATKEALRADAIEGRWPASVALRMLGVTVTHKDGFDHIEGLLG